MITLRVDFNDSNRLAKFSSAVSRLGKAMGLPVTVKPGKHSDHGEKWPFLALEQLVEEHKRVVSDTLDELYRELTAYLDLPMITEFRKARPDDPLIFKGKVLFDATSGKPLTNRQFRQIMKTIEAFLNRRLTKESERIVLDSITMGKILNRMLKYNTAEALQSMGLQGLEYGGVPFRDLSRSAAKLKEVFGLSQTEALRFDASRDMAASYITDIQDAVKSDVRRTLTRAVVQRQSRSEIAQELLHQFSSQNRDWHRVAETEMSDISNTAALYDMMNESGGEPLYVRRIEIMDARTCKFCLQATQKEIIARVLPEPPPGGNENIGDPVTPIAIWPGKSNYGRSQDNWWWPAGPVHPFCRGFWVPYIPEGDDDLGMLARKLQGEIASDSKRWGEATDRAREEFRFRGIEYPTDATTGFLDRIREIDREMKERP